MNRIRDFGSTPQITRGITGRPGPIRISGCQYAGWAMLFLLLLGELLSLALPYDARADMPLRSMRENAMRWFERGIRPAVLTAIVAATFFSRAIFKEEFDAAAARTGGRLLSTRWFGVHLIFLTALIVGSASRHAGRLISVGAWESWLLLWTVTAAAAFLAWCFAMLPPVFWRRWISGSGPAFAVGAAVGLGAFAMGAATSMLWRPLQTSTYVIVVAILRLLGQSPQVDASQFLIGTPNFVLTIGSSCSGIEGLGLVLAFVSAYLWYCRAELRFPAALILAPLGLSLIWLLNSVRIAALILIGNWNPDAAIKGFHSVAGWLFFNGVAGALVWGSSRSPWLTRLPEGIAEANPATPYLLPMMVIIAASMIAGSFGTYATTAYGVGGLAALLLMIFNWRRRGWPTPKPGIFPLLLGFAAAAIWRLAAGDSALSDFLLAPSALLAQRTMGPQMLWVSSALVAVPIAEELAFRGYLLRKLIDSDFRAVVPQKLTVAPLLVSSVVGGLIHHHWLAGIGAGLLSGSAMRRTGRVSDALLAHLGAAILLALIVIWRLAA